LTADGATGAGKRGELRLHILVLRCQTGDERAFAELLDWFGDRTLRYLESLVGPDAEDVQQDVWLAVYRSLRSLRDPRTFRTWLFRTTRHHAIDFLRRRKRQQRLLELVALTGDETEPPAVEEDTTMVVDKAALHAALERLSPAHQEVLLLRFRDGMSYAQIASVVGCPIGTVRTRLHHAKRKLYQVLR
jgi:RNA polymerase sigma-70 factor (ECF subfamily)